MAESGRSEFSFRLLIATTNLMGRTAKRTIEVQEKQASVLLLGDLDAAEVDWPGSPSDMRARRLPPKHPRPHQREAMNSVLKRFEGGRPWLVDHGLRDRQDPDRAVHPREARRRPHAGAGAVAVGQTLREWTANTTLGFDFLPVCSDATVAEPDAVVSNTSDLGFPVTTDAGEIAAFLRRRSGARVMFATYQSSPQIAKAFRLGRVPAFDLSHR